MSQLRRYLGLLLEEAPTRPNWWILFICCLLGAYWYRNLPPRIGSVVFYVWFALIVELVSKWLGLYQRNNYPALHLYTLGTFLFWSYFYKEHIGDFFRRNYAFIVIGCTGAILANTLWIQPLHTFNTFSINGVQILIILYAIAFAFRPILLLDNKEEPILRKINAGVLLYHAGSLFIFMSSFLMVFGDQKYKVLRYLNIGLLIIFYTIILYSLWQARHPVLFP